MKVSMPALLLLTAIGTAQAQPAPTKAKPVVRPAAAASAPNDPGQLKPQPALERRDKAAETQSNVLKKQQQTASGVSGNLK